MDKRRRGDVAESSPPSSVNFQCGLAGSVSCSQVRYLRSSLYILTLVYIVADSRPIDLETLDLEDRTARDSCVVLNRHPSSIQQCDSVGIIQRRMD